MSECPKCKSSHIARERRPNGNDICQSCHHTWPSSDTLNSKEKWWHPSEVWDWYKNHNRHEGGGSAFVSAPDHLAITKQLQTENAELKDKLQLEKRAVEHLENFSKRIQQDLTTTKQELKQAMLDWSADADHKREVIIGLENKLQDAVKTLELYKNVGVLPKTKGSTMVEVSNGVITNYTYPARAFLATLKKEGG